MSNAADFVIKDGELEKYKGSGGVVAIPDSVTSIGSWAFYGCTSLTAIEIPNSVTDIGDRAFSGCHKLEKLSIGNPKCKLGKGVFE